MRFYTFFNENNSEMVRTLYNYAGLKKTIYISLLGTKYRSDRHEQEITKILNGQSIG